MHKDNLPPESLPKDNLPNNSLPKDNLTNDCSFLGSLSIKKLGMTDTEFNLTTLLIGERSPLSMIQSLKHST